MHLTKGRYRARFASSPAEVERAQGLRDLCFRARRGLGGRDADRFDDMCRHMIVEEVKSGAMVCCFRLLTLQSGAGLGQSYSAQFYDLERLFGYDSPMIEMGRFCIHPDWHDPDILRLAWGALTKVVELAGAGMLFGCSSFDGAHPQAHTDALVQLAGAHLAPERWRPGIRAASVYGFAQELAGQVAHKSRAMLAMPPLLRTYLLMGGWVSDHAVVDRELNTMHVFTGLEIAAVPPGRARLLRALAG